MNRSVRAAALAAVLGALGTSCGGENPAGGSVIATLLTPAPGGTLGNDCTGPSWTFDWSDVPGATLYHLEVVGPTSPAPVIDERAVRPSAFTWTRPAPVPEAARQGWRWRVRAQVGGDWRDWSPESTFVVDPLVPALMSPAVGAVLDNGCRDGSNAMLWEFAWSECSTASFYHLHVMGATARIPVIDRDTIAVPHHTDVTTAWVADHNRAGWRWQVRARFANGWGEWSPVRTFDVEPVDTDCAR